MIDWRRLEGLQEDVLKEADRHRRSSPEIDHVLTAMAIVLGSVRHHYGPGDLDPVGGVGSDVETSVTKCARCGDSHSGLIFVKFNEPVLHMTHWAACPTTAEPMLMQVLDTGQQEPEFSPKVAMRKAWAAGFKDAIGKVRDVVRRRMDSPFTRHWGENIIDPAVVALAVNADNLSYGYDQEEEGS